jgi:hypothetical protein
VDDVSGLGAGRLKTVRAKTDRPGEKMPSLNGWCLRQGELNVPYVVTEPESISGIYDRWAECHAAVSGVSGVRYQKVGSREGGRGHAGRCLASDECPRRLRERAGFRTSA